MTDSPFGEPVTILHVGELVSVAGPGTTALIGRITNVTPLHSPNGPAGFVIHCHPQQEGGRNA